jgi:hypothetical protein
VRFTRAVLAIVCAVLAVFMARERKERSDQGVVTVAEQQVVVPGACRVKSLSGNGAGPIRVGMSVDSIKTLCHVARDTVQRGLEGMPERRIIVAFPPDMVEAEIVDGRLWRLDITSPAFRTTDSLGVGSTLSEFLRLDQLQGLVGEGVLVLISKQHCGLSFMLHGGIPEGGMQNWTKDALSKLPASSKVEKVYVFGCTPDHRPSLILKTSSYRAGPPPSRLR